MEPRPLSATQEARRRARSRPRGYQVRATQAQERWGLFVEELEARPWPGQRSISGQPPIAGTHRVVECRECGVRMEKHSLRLTYCRGCCVGAPQVADAAE
eukprot:6716529-Alexandrium_andersonii.AAC.1